HHHVSAQRRPVWLGRILHFSEVITAKLLIRMRMRVLTVSLETQRWLEGTGMPRERISLTGNGSSLYLTSTNQATSSERQAMQHLENERFILFCGRISRLKGADDLASVCPEILSRRPETKFVFCGPEDLVSR